MKKPGTTEKASKYPNNRDFTNFCPHLSPLEEKRKGVREIIAPLWNCLQRGQTGTNCSEYPVYRRFRPFSICPRILNLSPAGDKILQSSFIWGDCKPLYLSPFVPISVFCPLCLFPYPCFVPFVCPHIRILSPLFVPISVFCPRRGQILSPRLSWGQNRLSPCPVRVHPLHPLFKRTDKGTN